MASLYAPFSRIRTYCTVSQLCLGPSGPTRLEENGTSVDVSQPGADGIGGLRQNFPQAVPVELPTHAGTRLAVV